MSDNSWKISQNIGALKGTKNIVVIIVVVVIVVEVIIVAVVS